MLLFLSSDIFSGLSIKISDQSALNIKQQLVKLPSQFFRPLFFPRCDLQSNKRRFPILSQKGNRNISFHSASLWLTLTPDTSCHHINSLSGFFILGGPVREQEKIDLYVCVCVRYRTASEVAALDPLNTQPHEVERGNLCSVNFKLFFFFTMKRIIKFNCCQPSLLHVGRSTRLVGC